MNDENEILFSIVIPTYNREKFIVQTLESVLSQTFRSYEIIVVDNCSADKTEEILQPYIASQKIRFIKHDRNYERGRSRNTGIKSAIGKYISFLDSDDLLYENHLTAAIEMIKKYDEPEIFHLGYETKNIITGESQKFNELPEVANDLLYKGNLFSTNSIFIRRDVALVHHFSENSELSGSEDYDLWMRLAARFPIYCSNNITSVITQHDDRTMMNLDMPKIEKRIELAWNNLWEDKMIYQKYKKHKSFMFAYKEAFLALHYSMAKDKKAAFKKLVNAILFYPLIIKQKIVYAVARRIIFN